MLGSKRKCPAGQILEITLENCKKSPLEHLTKTTIFG